MTPQEKLIETAKAELGYRESANNWNKYAEEIDRIAGFYNTPKQNAPWCDVFADWCFARTFGADVGRRMLYQPERSLGAGCKYSMQYFKDAGAFTKDPAIGDQIFYYDSKKEVNHMGIVYGLTDSTVTAIEGNSSDMVKLVSYKRSSATIAGYGRPNWSLAAESLESPEPEAPQEKTIDLKAIAANLRLIADQLDGGTEAKWN